MGHGSPMNALERNRYTEAWAASARRSPGPRAVLCVSAHWYTNATAVTAMAAAPHHPRLLRVPRRALRLRVPVPGRARVGRRGGRGGRAALGRARPRQLGHRPRHLVGPRRTCTPTPTSRSCSWPSTRRAARVPLRPRHPAGAVAREGVLILASGNVVHNLGLMAWSSPRPASTGRSASTRRLGHGRRLPGDVLRLAEHPDYALAVPTPDHFIPLLYFAGVAAAGRRRRRPRCSIDGYANGSLSMTCYTA